MPNLVPLITHRPDNTALYALAGAGGNTELSYQISTSTASTVFQPTTTAINLATLTGLNFTAGKAYLVALELTIVPIAPLVANTTDSMIMAVSAGASVGRSAIYPLWNLGTQTASIGFTCILPVVTPAAITLSFGNPNQAALAQTYTVTVQSTQIVELGTA